MKIGEHSINYSINPVLYDRVDQNGLQKVYIRIIHRRLKLDYPTPIRVAAGEFLGGRVVNRDGKDEYNKTIKAIKAELERRLLDAIVREEINSREDFLNLFKEPEKIAPNSVEQLEKLLSDLKGIPGVLIRVEIQVMPESVLAKMNLKK